MFIKNEMLAKQTMKYLRFILSFLLILFLFSIAYQFGKYKIIYEFVLQVKRTVFSFSAAFNEICSNYQ